MTDTFFNYEIAFARNTGWVTPEEQQLLKQKRIAIAGLGGVGGNHMITATRLGINNFSIADFDAFDLANFNRQTGSSVSTLGKPKLEVLKNMALDINPNLNINTFPSGVTEANIDDFLDGVDLYIDSLDFFVLDIRRMIFAKCYANNIPAITVAPIGMGAALLTFIPGKMSFEDYFRLDGQPEKEQLMRFLVGLSPRLPQKSYLAVKSAFDLEQQKAPSTPMAIQLCSGIALTTGLKLLLNRGNVIAAPHGLHFDAYKNKLIKTWRPGGNNNPLQLLILLLAKLFMKRS